jgi:hypothetical protein
VNRVRVLERTMLATELLVGGGGWSPRWARRRAASWPLRPAAAAGGACASSVTGLSVVSVP